jgi:hypothetical protein
VLLALGLSTPVIAQQLTTTVPLPEADTPTYEAQYGHWETIELPDTDRVNAVHTALLHTGKLLIVAGSGANQAYFEAGTFKTLVWNPVTGEAKLVPTPSDFFCGGHAFLPNGNLLVAGGTQRYEVPAEKIEYAGGALKIENRLPVTRQVPAGTTFVSYAGGLYKSDETITLPPATPIPGKHNRGRFQPSLEDVRINSVVKGAAGVLAQGGTYHIQGLSKKLAASLNVFAGAMTLEKEQWEGANFAAEFDPITERYVYVLPMPHKRWYPTLTTEENGNVLSVSGIDGAGLVQAGATDVFNPHTGRWSKGPVRYFPTYPALFLMDSGKLFFSGSTTGYGSASKGRQPGLWNLKNNTFQLVPGLPEPGEVETSGSVLLPPAQKQKVMLIGGGGIGESPLTTARTAIASLAGRNPSYTRGPNLAAPARYPLSAILPDDTVLVTGGSEQYRGEHESDIHLARIYNPETNSFSVAAPPEIGRDYHSEAILLPDGRVATLGSDPLYANKADTVVGRFEQRIEIYSPPYLFHGPRPVVTGGPSAVARGGAATFTTPDSGEIEKVRLIYPSAGTHDTDVEERSIAISFTRTPGGLHIKIPSSAGLVPLGWYMLFVDNNKGVPSVARWVQVT